MSAPKRPEERTTALTSSNTELKRGNSHSPSNARDENVLTLLDLGLGEDGPTQGHSGRSVYGPSHSLNSLNSPVRRQCTQRRGSRFTPSLHASVQEVLRASHDVVLADDNVLGEGAATLGLRGVYV